MVRVLSFDECIAQPNIAPRNWDVTPRKRKPNPDKKRGRPRGYVNTEPYLPIVQDFINAMLQDSGYAEKMVTRAKNVNATRVKWRGDITQVPVQKSHVRVGAPRETSQQTLRRIFDEVDHDPAQYLNAQPTWCTEYLRGQSDVRNSTI